MAILLIPVSHQSLWVDEGYMAYFASQPSFSKLHSTFIACAATPSSEVYMPGYITYLWLWAKFFGISEVGLRLSNIPFAVTFIFSLSLLCRRKIYPRLLMLLAAIHPLVWFYMNEARPYMGMLAFSTLSATGLILYLHSYPEDRTSGPWLCLIGILCSLFLNLLALVEIPALIIVGIFSARGNKSARQRVKSFRDWRLPLLIIGPLLISLSVLYLHYFLRGSGKMPVKPGLINLGSVFYGFLGFSGLGPPRFILRNISSWLEIRPYLITLFLGLAGVVVIIFKWLKLTIRPGDQGLHRINLNLGAFIATLIVFFSFSRELSFGFSERHLISIFPFLLFALTGLLSGKLPSESGKRANILLTLLVALLWIFSSVRIRFDSIYFKDDYRSAAQLALRSIQNKEEILWAAALPAGGYYGLATEDLKLPPRWLIKKKVINASSWNYKEIVDFISKHNPEILVLSHRPDVFDSKSGWRRYLCSHKYQQLGRSNCFSIYRIFKTKKIFRKMGTIPKHS